MNPEPNANTRTIENNYKYELYKTSKGQFKEVIANMDFVICACDELENTLAETPLKLSAEDEEILDLKLFKEVSLNHKSHVETRLKQIQTKIYELCPHQFVFDLIDLTPDTSKYIKYCELCELTVDAVNK